MSNLPLDIINDILSRLPVKSLVRFLCVSNRWYILINGQAFIKLHLYRSIESNTDRTLIVQEQNACIPFDYFSVSFHDEIRFGKPLEIHQPLHCSTMSTDILSCCDGLVCIYNQWGEEIAIWNPLIRKYRKLPSEPIEKPPGFSNSWPISLAFGYDKHNDDYKVLRVVRFFNMDKPGKEFEVKVCSIRLQCWKKIEDQWPNKEWSICSDSVFSNGALHWLVAEEGQSPENIVAFDLATEKFWVIRMPIKAPTSCVTCLEVLEGQLCFIVIVDEMYNDVWLMKEYGEESSWTWIYKIEQGVVGSTFEYCKPLMCSKNNRKKILMEESHRCRTYLIWYDIQKKIRKRVKIPKLPEVFQTVTCVGSLLLLDGDNMIDPTQKNNRNESPSEHLNPLVKGVIY
ncbi:F-box protein CPR1-like [Castanea sativa]|uniref:F-box protein CPR1-like n=1 Tax=Castanea sativa TaxID=21020 RepID=UPI003F64F6DA